MYLVKEAKFEVKHKSRPFYKCVSHTTEGLEYKFDATDKEHCKICEPKLLGADPSLNRTEDFVKPVLKSLDNKDIDFYEQEILHPKVKEYECNFYIDKLTLGN